MAKIKFAQTKNRVSAAYNDPRLNLYFLEHYHVKDDSIGTLVQYCSIPPSEAG